MSCGRVKPAFAIAPTIADRLEFVMDLTTCENPIFIIGSPRSGTSILAWSLAEHSQLEVFAESTFLWKIFGNGYAEKAYESAKARPDGRDWLSLYDVTRSEFLGYLGVGLNALMSSRCPGKRWIDQTPHNTLMADTLAELFPGAFFIHILRDGRKVVHSMINFENVLGKDRAKMLKDSGLLSEWAKDFPAACKAWSWYVESSMRFCEKHRSRSMTVLNEKLRSDSEKHFRLILDRLDLPYEQAVADFFRTYRINSSFREAPQEANADDRVIDSWQQWSDEQRETFVREAAPTMLKHGLATASAFNRENRKVSQPGLAQVRTR